MPTEASTASSASQVGMPVRRWYQAGELWLCIDVPPGAAPFEGRSQQHCEPVQDLLDAIVLDDHDPLLGCLDLWLDRELDWKPSPEAPIDPLLSIQTIQGQNRMVTFACTEEYRKTLPAIPAAWGKLVQVHWHVIQARLLLDSFTVSASEQSKISQGACILLPASFISRWTAQLLYNIDSSQYASQVLKNCQVSVDAEKSCLRIGKSAPSAIVEREASADSDAACRVRIVLADELNLNVLRAQAQWAQRKDWQLSLARPLESLMINVHLHDAASSASDRDFVGQLCPMGQGWGVLVGQRLSSADNRKSG